MVVFSCPHMGAFWQVCTLRFTRYKRENAVLLAPNTFLQSKYVQNFIDTKIFDSIVPVRFPNVQEYCGSEKELSKAILQYYDKLFDEKGINLKKVKDFLLWADVENLFSIYLSVKGVQHTLVELEPGQFAKDSRYSVNVQYLHWGISYETLHRRYYALCGEGGNIINRILFGDEDKRINEKDEVYNFKKNFLAIDHASKKELLKCLELSGLSGDGSCIFLLNSLGYTMPHTKLTRSNFYLSYQIIIDYLRESDVIVKDHPQTHDVGFEQAFARAKKLDNVVPIEFFSLEDKLKLRKIYSANSTGGDKLLWLGSIEESVKLGDIFLKEFRNLHKLYTAFCTADLVKTQKTRFHYFGLNKQLVENFNRYMFESLWGQDELHGLNPEILAGDIFVFIGAGAERFSPQLQKALENAPENVKVAFLDTKAIPFSAQKRDDEILPFLRPIRIRKTACADTLCDSDDEYIYLYCKSTAVREQLENLQVQKYLNNTGIRVSLSGRFADVADAYKDLRDYARGVRVAQLTEEVAALRSQLSTLSGKFEKMVDFFAAMEKEAKDK